MPSSSSGARVTPFHEQILKVALLPVARTGDEWASAHDVPRRSLGAGRATAAAAAVARTRGRGHRRPRRSAADADGTPRLGRQPTHVRAARCRTRGTGLRRDPDDGAQGRTTRAEALSRSEPPTDDRLRSARRPRACRGRRRRARARGLDARDGSSSRTSCHGRPRCRAARPTAMASSTSTGGSSPGSDGAGPSEISPSGRTPHPSRSRTASPWRPRTTISCST